jgi:hypothetical protein
VKRGNDRRTRRIDHIDLWDERPPFVHPIHFQHQGRRRAIPPEQPSAMPDRIVWGHIGATIGRETRGIKGKRRDVKPQVTGHFTLIVPGHEGAAIGLENRLRGDPYVGSNPTPPALPHTVTAPGASNHGPDRSSVSPRPDGSATPSGGTRGRPDASRREAPRRATAE